MALEFGSGFWASGFVGKPNVHSSAIKEEMVLLKKNGANGDATMRITATIVDSETFLPRDSFPKVSRAVKWNRAPSTDIQRQDRELSDLFIGHGEAFSIEQGRSRRLVANTNQVISRLAQVCK